MTVLLELTGVSVSLGGRRVITETSLAVKAGDVVALLGANGAGKTTVIRASLGLVPLGAGAVRLSGQDPVLLSPRQRALRAAYLPQRPQAIWPLSVERLVALGRYAHGAPPDRLGVRDQAAVDAALDACAMTALRDRPMDQISGGERARAHLARALAQNAPLLLLDEPTAGLDPAQALGLADIIRAHAESGGAVVFSTHDVGLAVRAAQAVVVLRGGQIIAQGEPEAALTPSVLEAAYNRKGRLARFDGVTAVVFE